MFLQAISLFNHFSLLSHVFHSRVSQSLPRVFNHRAKDTVNRYSGLLQHRGNLFRPVLDFIPITMVAFLLDWGRARRPVQERNPDLGKDLGELSTRIKMTPIVYLGNLS